MKDEKNKRNNEIEDALRRLARQMFNLPEPDRKMNVDKLLSKFMDTVKQLAEDAKSLGVKNSNEYMDNVYLKRSKSERITDGRLISMMREMLYIRLSGASLTKKTVNRWRGVISKHMDVREVVNRDLNATYTEEDVKEAEEAFNGLIDEINNKQ